MASSDMAPKPRQSMPSLLKPCAGDSISLGITSINATYRNVPAKDDKGEILAIGLIAPRESSCFMWK